MTDTFTAVDAYLATNFKINLEKVLVEASVYRLAPELVGTVEITCQETGCFQCSDGGKIYHYEGAIIVAKIAYQYRLWIHEERGGARYMTDLREFAAVDWRSRSKIYGRPTRSLFAALATSSKNGDRAMPNLA